jgi:type 1 glutamine amidotransferase
MRQTVRLSLFALLSFCLLNSTALAEGKKKIVFIAGTPSHGFAQHEQNAGVLLLAKYLNDAMPDKIETVVFNSHKDDGGKWVNGWPNDPAALVDAAAIIIFCDGGGGHIAIPHIKEVDDLTKKGVGIGCIHYAVEVPKGESGDALLRWIGGYFETYWSINPHWKATITSIPNHPVGNGVKPFSTNDEWYYHMRFRENMEGVTPIVAAIPPDSTRKGKDDPHGGNPEVRGGIGKSLPEVLVWVAENKETGSRGFGCTGAHFHFNWAQDDYRKAILNAIVWTAKIDVPSGGVESKRPTAADLLANLDQTDEKKKHSDKDVDEAEIAKKIEEMNMPATK